MAARIAAEHPDVRRVLLFGSHARGDYGTRSDIDLLVVLGSSALPVAERIAALLPFCSEYPTDVFPLTEAELAERLRTGDPFWTAAMADAVDLAPATTSAHSSVPPAISWTGQ
jgi:hypothetical protein